MVGLQGVGQWWGCKEWGSGGAARSGAVVGLQGVGQ